MTKEKNTLKKIKVPTIKDFNGEVAAVCIFEEIMHRQRYTSTDREVLTAKIETVVRDEIDRQKQHKKAVAFAKRHNSKVA